MTNKVGESEYKKHRKKINDRTLLLSINETIGNLCFYNNEPIILGKSAAYININNRVDVRYMYQALSFDATQQRFEDGLTGSTIKNLGIGVIKSTLLGLPSKKEQIAIANALSDVDALLTELENLIAKKQAIKTATMQQLLTGKTRLQQFATYTEGEKKGQSKSTKPSELGEIPEDWDIAALDDIGQTIIGLTYCPNDVSDYGTIVLRSSNVQKNILAYENNVFVDMDLPDRVIVKEGDILVCVRNGSRNLIGKCALIDKQAEGSAFGAFMSIYRTKLYGFMFYQFQSSIIQIQINEIMGATINQITNKDMAGFKVPLPSDKKEQIAITAIMSDMDNEIHILEQRLKKTRQIKQGMMQELLTGKTRLV
jgi:type I restriction enzyme S subunit